MRSARAMLDGRADDVLVLSGDTPLITAELLGALATTHRESGAEATVLSFELDDPGSYGRVLRNGNGGLEAIVEAADATPAQLEVREVNSSIYVFRSDRLWPVLDRLEPHNAQGELYLTDSVALLVGRRWHGYRPCCARPRGGDWSEYEVGARRGCSAPA